jgi:hypothetical protein
LSFISEPTNRSSKAVFLFHDSAIANSDDGHRNGPKPNAGHNRPENSLRAQNRILTAKPPKAKPTSPKYRSRSPLTFFKSTIAQQKIFAASLKQPWLPPRFTIKNASDIYPSDPLLSIESGKFAMR